MATAFSEYTKTDAEKRINDSFKDYKDDFESNKKFYSGDHYQDGDGWAGALPSTSKDKSATLKKIQALFSSQNVIKEVVCRLRDAVISKDPTWNVHLTRILKEEEGPKDEEQKVIDETEQALTEWWKDYDIHGVLKEYVKIVSIGKKAVLRIYVPATFTDGGNVKSGDFTEQLDKIRVEVVDGNKATVYEDKDEAQSAGLLSYKDEDDNEIIEICYLNEKGETIVRSIIDGKPDDSAPVNLQGNLLMHESGAEMLITKQVRQLNKMVNKAHTMMNGNLDNGFLERIFLNAQPPGKWEKDSETGEDVFKPDPVNVGPNTINFLAGLETEDEDGKKRIATPSVNFREPVPNETFVEAKESAYRSILEEVHQKHALISGDASPSGESRIQALVDFIKSAQEYKSDLDTAGRWLLKTVMYLAWDFAGQASRSEQYSVDFDARIDPGHLPAEMRNQIITEYEKGMLSRETAMAMLGVDDIDAEISRIDTATAHVKEVFEVLEVANIKPKTLMVELINKVIADKEILTDLKEGDKANAIKAEIEAILDRSVQEDDLTGALGLS
jgi:hypothetical protein